MILAILTAVRLRSAAASPRGLVQRRGSIIEAATADECPPSIHLRKEGEAMVRAVLKFIVRFFSQDGVFSAHSRHVV